MAVLNRARQTFGDVRLVAWALDAWLTTQMLIAGGAAVVQGLGQETFDSLIETHAERRGLYRAILEQDEELRPSLALVALLEPILAQFWEQSVQALMATWGSKWLTSASQTPSRFRPASCACRSCARAGPAGRTSTRSPARCNCAGRRRPPPRFPSADRAWLLKKLASKLTSDGDLIVASNLTRDQGRNRVDAEAKLAALVVAALVRPKKRRATKPSQAAQGATD